MSLSSNDVCSAAVTDGHVLFASVQREASGACEVAGPERVDVLVGSSGRTSGVFRLKWMARE